MRRPAGRLTRTCVGKDNGSHCGIRRRIVAIALREALTDYLTEKGIRSSEDPPDKLYKDDWFRFYVGHRSFRFLKLGSAIHSVAVHDAHHLITGYGTDMRGEAELTGWELASGGCGRHWVMWIDRLIAIPTLMLFFPRASLRAIQRGWKERNLYQVDFEEALSTEFDEVRRRVTEATDLAA